jgi:hypothetical protein
MNDKKNIKQIAELLFKIYSHHEFQIIQVNFDMTVNLLSNVLPDNMVYDFFNDLSHGKLGVLYKSPTSILSMAYRYYNDYNGLYEQPKKHQSYEDMMKPDWKRI